MKILAALIIISLSACNTQESQIVSKADSIAERKRMEEEILEEAKPAFIEAYKTVLTIKLQAEMADSGKLDKRSVIEQYNVQLAPYMGKLNSISDIKIRLDTAGEAFAKMMWYKAAADIAVRNAAENQANSEFLKRN